MSDWKVNLALQSLRKASPEDVLRMMDAALPAVVETLPPDQRALFLNSFFQRHLVPLMEGMTQAQRRELWQSLRPHLPQEFHIDRNDCDALFE